MLCLVQFLLTFDDTAVNVAIPQLLTDLGFSTAGVTWVANAYFLTFGGLLLLGGRLGDVFGRRRVFLLALASFGVASVVSGLAQTPAQLVAGRLMQGAAAAVVSPTALALIALQFPAEEDRARAFSVWGAVAGAGGVSGLVLAGLLIDTGSWRWIFLVNPPIVTAVLFVVARLVVERRDSDGPKLDVAGAVVGTAAVSALIFALLRASEHGWVHAGSMAAAFASLALAALFVSVERRAPSPLVPFWFVSFPPRAVAIASNLLFAAAFFSLSFLLMLQLQRVLGYTALRAAIAYLPHGLALLAGVALSSIALERFGAGRSLTAAMVIGATGMVLVGAMPHGNEYLVDLLPGIVLTGFASGLGFPVLAVAALVGTDEDNAGLGSALLSASQQLGGALGLAVFVNIATRSSAAGALDALADGISKALIGVGVVLLVGAAIASRLPGSAPPVQAQLPGGR
jgi:EmrB/QacA subfamily drug resistance transporter